MPAGAIRISSRSAAAPAARFSALVASQASRGRRQADRPDRGGQVIAAHVLRGVGRRHRVCAAAIPLPAPTAASASWSWLTSCAGPAAARRRRVARCQPHLRQPAVPRSQRLSRRRGRSIATPGDRGRALFHGQRLLVSVINPMLTAGQAHGGVIQGIGQALMERTVWRRQGPPRSPVPFHGLRPAARSRMRRIFPSRTIRCRAKTNLPGRQRLRREAPAAPAPCRRSQNAVVDALEESGITAYLTCRFDARVTARR